MDCSSNTLKNTEFECAFVLHLQAIFCEYRGCHFIFFPFYDKTICYSKLIHGKEDSNFGGQLAS